MYVHTSHCQHVLSPYVPTTAQLSRGELKTSPELQRAQTVLNSFTMQLPFGAFFFVSVVVRVPGFCVSCVVTVMDKYRVLLYSIGDVLY